MHAYYIDCIKQWSDLNQNCHLCNARFDSRRYAFTMKKSSVIVKFIKNASFLKWRPAHLLVLLKFHPLPCLLTLSLFFFMAVEYTLRMIPSSAPPFDLSFIVTLPFHRFLASSPALNNLLAGLNTVFVFMQTSYILWTWIVEGRLRATIAALFMFTFRGILGYSTQLPLPQAPQAWMDWIIKKLKAFDQRGDMAIAAWAEQQQREMNLRVRRLSRSKIDPDEERRILAKEKKASLENYNNTLRRHTLVLRKRVLMRKKTYTLRRLQ